MESTEISTQQEFDDYVARLKIELHSHSISFRSWISELDKVASEHPAMATDYNVRSRSCRCG